MLACQQYQPVPKVSIDRLAAWVDAISECYIHDRDGFANVHENVETVLDWMEVPKEWKAVVRVMADGAHYYGEGVWWAKHVDPSTREDWMDEFWEQN